MSSNVSGSLNKIKTIDTWSLKLSSSMGAKGTIDFNE